MSRTPSSWNLASWNLASWKLASWKLASRRTGLLLLLACACAAALWTFAGGREARHGDAAGAPSRAAEPAAAVADRAPAAPSPDAATGSGSAGAAAAPPVVPQTGPFVAGSTLVESRPDGTQVLDGIPCQVRQPDGTMSSRPVRITIQPAAVVPIESGGTAPGHR